MLKNDRGSGYLANSQGISNFSSLRNEIKQEPKGNKHFNARGDNNFIFETSLPIERPICEQYIYSEKKDGGNWPVIKLKELNQKIPFRTFQNG